MTDGGHVPVLLEAAVDALLRRQIVGEVGEDEIVIDVEQRIDQRLWLEVGSDASGCLGKSVQLGCALLGGAVQARVL